MEAARVLASWSSAVFLALALAGCGGGASFVFFSSDFDDDSVLLDPVSQQWLGTWTGTLALTESTQSPSCPTPVLAGGPAQTVTITAHRDASLHVEFWTIEFDTTPWRQQGAGPYLSGDLVMTSILANGSNATWHLSRSPAGDVEMSYSQLTPASGVPSGCFQRWSGALNRLP